MFLVFSKCDQTLTTCGHPRHELVTFLTSHALLKMKEALFGTYKIIESKSVEPCQEWVH